MMKLLRSEYSFIPIFIVLLTVLFNDNTLIVATSLSSLNYAFISLGIYIAIFFFLSFQIGSTALNSSLLEYIAVCSICLLFTTIVTWDFHVTHALIIFLMFQAAIVTRFVKYEDYTRIYVKTISVLAALSVFMQILTSVVPAILSFARVVYNSNNVLFYSFFLYFRSNNEGFRNYGFYTEPGDYQHYLNLALILYFYFFPKTEKKKWMPVVLTIAVLTTFSPTGMVVCALIWTSYILANSADLRRTVLSIFGILFLLGFVFSIDSLRDILSNYTVLKLSGAKSNSLGGRISAITSGLKCFINSPLWGNGFTKGSEIMSQSMLADGFRYHQTSTTTAFLAFFGLPLTLLFTVPYVKAFITQKCNTKVALFVLIAALFFTINSERYVWDLSYYIFMMYGIRKILLPNEEKILFFSICKDAKLSKNSNT